MSDKPFNLGVIASVKRGFEHFVHRELGFLEQRGARISVYPAKFRKGMYNALPSWNVFNWSLPGVLLAQPTALLRNPARYFSLLKEAFSHGAITEFLLAVFFAPRMAEVDLIYATFGDRKLFIGYFCKRLTGKPLTCTIHAYEIYDNPNPKMFRTAIEACDQIVTISQYNVTELQQRFGIDPSRVEVIRLSIDLDAYQPAEKFIVLIVGFFVERKGHEVLFRALQQLNREDVEVWVVGDKGAEDDALDVRQLSADLGVEDKVAFFGKLSGTALKSVYHACDVFCLPCHFDHTGLGEGFPTVLIEAMACGKPVISTRHVEIPNVVEQILVDEKDIDGLAQAIESVVGSAEERVILGQRNRDLAIEYFSTENVNRTAQLMRSLLE